MSDFKKLYNEQLAKYNRLKNGVKYALKKVDNLATEYHEKLQVRANWELVGKRDAMNEAHKIFADTILGHIKDFENEAVQPSTQTSKERKAQT